MTTTDVMEGEDIGGLIRRHFLSLGLAAGLAVGGVASAVLWSNNNNTPISENPAVIVQTEEKSEAYKAMADKYSKQVETGRKYVAEKHNVPLEQVEAVVLDEAAAKRGCHDRIPDDRRGPDSSPETNLLYGVFKHPNGYLNGFVGQDSKVYGETDFLYCNKRARTVAQQFLRHLDKKGVGISSFKRVVALDKEYKDDRGFEQYHPPKSDELYEITITTGYGSTPAMCPSYSTYDYTFIFDAEDDFVVGRSQVVHYEDGVCTTEKEKTANLPLPRGLSIGNEPHEQLIIK